MPQQACVFCQRDRTRVKITKEHVISQWVDEILTADLLGPDRSFERIVVGVDGIAQTKVWPSEVVAAIEAPVVCGSQKAGDDGCNDGWMSELDGQAKNILRPMMLGHTTTLSPGDQRIIAAWAAMKSMILEYAWGQGQVIVLPQAARTFVFREQRAPREMHVRIAAVESNGRPMLFPRRVYQLQPELARAGALPQFISCSTLVLGCFVVQTLGSSAVGSAAPARPPGRDYLAINPPSGTDLTWPPAEVFDDAGLDRFADPWRTETPPDDTAFRSEAR